MNIYFSNKSGTMILRILRNVLPKTAVSSRHAPTNMGFSVAEMPAGDTIEETPGLIARRMIKLNGVYFYAVGDRAPSTADVRNASLAKTAVIDSLSVTSTAVGLQSFGRARDIAKQELSRHAGIDGLDDLSYFVAHDTVGYGPLSILMEDGKNIEEIEVNSPTGPISVYTTRFGRCATNLSFASEQSFRHGINRLIYDSEKEISDNMPIIDAQVGNARVHAQIRPYAINGGAASIRIGKGKSMGAFSLVKNQTVSPELLAYLWTAMESNVNIIISGAPGSGKTTLVYALSQFVPRHCKVITIEDDVNELCLNGPLFNTVALYGSKYSGISAKTQVLNALRMRPDRIICGEIRGDEAAELFSGANLGTPFMTTMHSSDEDLAVIKKLTVKPMSVEYRALSMLDLSIYMKQSGLGQRTVSSVIEYRWLSRAETDTGTEVGDSDLVSSTRAFESSRPVPGLLDISKVMSRFAEKHGLSRNAAKKEFDRKTRVIRSAAESSENEGSFTECILRRWNA